MTFKSKDFEQAKKIRKGLEIIEAKMRELDLQKERLWNELAELKKRCKHPNWQMPKLCCPDCKGQPPLRRLLQQA